MYLNGIDIVVVHIGFRCINLYSFHEDGGSKIGLEKALYFLETLSVINLYYVDLSDNLICFYLYVIN